MQIPPACGLVFRFQRPISRDAHLLRCTDCCTENQTAVKRCYLGWRRQTHASPRVALNSCARSFKISCRVDPKKDVCKFGREASSGKLLNPSHRRARNLKLGTRMSRLAVHNYLIGAVNRPIVGFLRSRVAGILWKKRQLSTKKNKMHILKDLLFFFGIECSNTAFDH